MKFFKQFTLFALLALLAFSSCKKDEFFETDIEVPTVDPRVDYQNGLLARSSSSSEGLDLICVSVDYPFELLLLDSTTVEINSEDDLNAASSDPENYPVDFVYPLDVTDGEGNQITVNNAEELAALFAACIPNTGWGDDWGDWFFPAWQISFQTSCYQLVYPLTLLNVDSAAVTASGENEFIALLADGNIYSFAFPLSLEDEDGNTVSADDPEDLFDLLAECGSGSGSGGMGIGTYGCYDLGYPATLILLDGNTTVVNNDDEFVQVLMLGGFMGFSYPVTLIDGDGNEIVINNEDELNEAILACGFPSGGGGGGILLQIGCYEISYPAPMLLIDGSTVIVNDETELLDLLNTGNFGGFGYPLTLIDEDGNATTVNDDDGLEAALEACEPNGGGGNPAFGDYFCYNFSYPVSFNDNTTGVQVTINSAAEWQAYTNSSQSWPAPLDFVYPVNLLDAETGAALSVNNAGEFSEAIEDCW